MARSTKTVSGSLISNTGYETNCDPLTSMKYEAVDRMRTALLSASLEDPLSAATAIQQVTIMRVYHQVARIVQYLDLMDKLENAMYSKISSQIDSIEYNYDGDDFSAITKLLAIQEKLQKSIIESNKLLAPYLDMEQYPAFTAIDAPTPVSQNVLEVEATQRNLLRENASSVLKELEALSTSPIELAQE